MIEAETTALFDRKAYSGRARLRLFCFPYAGGGSILFQHWNHWLAGIADVCPAQLPGRETRLAERPFTDLHDAVAAAVVALRPLSEKPFALFGYSMGALIAYHVSRALETEQRGPKALIVAASPAPHIPRKRAPTWDLPTREFLERLQELGGTASGMLNSPEALDLFLPCLRADFRLVETYSFVPGPPLACPIRAYVGAEDSHVSHEDMRAWKEHTKNRFSVETVPGDHFFIRTSQLQFLTSFARVLANLS